MKSTTRTKTTIAGQQGAGQAITESVIEGSLAGNGRTDDGRTDDAGPMMKGARGCDASRDLGPLS
ncbi:MAG: hypothetical protein LCH82_11425 [Actinobacteria bacterium]|nr:hypothetical protein [Actinomycetota bacterium]